ncbi:hypothetical protein Aduo_019518 [Ancylostoma duodenale]
MWGRRLAPEVEVPRRTNVGEKACPCGKSAKAYECGGEGSPLSATPPYIGGRPVWHYRRDEFSSPFTPLAPLPPFLYYPTGDPNNNALQVPYQYYQIPYAMDPPNYQPMPNFPANYQPMPNFSANYQQRMPDFSANYQPMPNFPANNQRMPNIQANYQRNVRTPTNFTIRGILGQATESRPIETTEVGPVEVSKVGQVAPSSTEQRTEAVPPAQPEVVVKEEPQDDDGPPPPKRVRGLSVNEILEVEDDDEDPYALKIVEDEDEANDLKGKKTGPPASRMHGDGVAPILPEGNNESVARIQLEHLPVETVEVTEANFPVPPPNMWQQRYFSRFEEAEQDGDPYQQNVMPPRHANPSYDQPPFLHTPGVQLPYPPLPHAMPFSTPFGQNHGATQSMPDIVIKEEPEDVFGPPTPKRVRRCSDDVEEDADDPKGHTVGASAPRMRAGGSVPMPPEGDNAPMQPIQLDVPPQVGAQVEATSAPPANMWERRYVSRFEGVQQYENFYLQNFPPCPPYFPPRYPHHPYDQPPFPHPPGVPLPYPHPPHFMPFLPPFNPDHGPFSFPQNNWPNEFMVQNGPPGFPLPEQCMRGNIPPNSTFAMGAPRWPGFGAAPFPNKRG